MKNQKIKILTVFLPLLFLATELFAFEYHIAGGKSWPRFMAQSSTYESPNGSLNFTPEPSEITVGTNMMLAVIQDDWMINYEKLDYNYNSTYSSNILDITVETQRIGWSLYYHQELAALYLGGGVQNSRESFTYQSTIWSQTKTSIYGQWGVDFIFGALRIRGGQSMGRVSGFNVYTNNVNLLFAF